MTTVRARLRRLPLRIRLVGGFVVAMAVLLCAAGAFVYWRVRVDLDTELRRELDDAAAEVAPLAGPDGLVVAGDGAPAVRLHQVIAADGTVRSAGADAGTVALLDADQLRRAATGPVRLDVGSLLPASDRPLRVLARPLPAAGAGTVLVVAVRRDQRDEALRELLLQLAIAGFLALLIAAVIGERLAKAALAPVERFRVQAEAIARDAGGRRLEVAPDRDDEVTRLGRTFNDVLDALERALVRERRFVDDASHELRTPLTLLLARVQLLQRGRREPDQYRAGLAELETDIGELVGLADALLAGRDAAPPSGPVEPQRLADALGPRLLTELGIEPSAVPAVDVAIAPDDLRRIVTNVLSNARVHGRGPVEAVVSADADVVVVEVHDHGDGIDPAFAPTATERFRRGADAQNRPGSGLGLALVAQLLDRHGGTLRICAHGRHHESGVPCPRPCTHADTGTTVTMLLPRTTAA